MAMDLVSTPLTAWFEIDDRYFNEMIERRRLLAADRDAVFAAGPDSGVAREEALTMIVDNLTTTHPDWFSREAGGLRNHLTGETWTAGSLDPLELAGRLVQEDLCVIHPTEDGPIFTAAILCFPSRWRLWDKIGKPLAAVHGPVPLYADRLSRPVDRFFRSLKPDRIVERLNWSLLDDPTLFQPGGKWRDASDDAITPDNVADRVFLRVERQTLRALPASGSVLFGIRVHVYPLSRVIGSAEQAATLAEAVRALPAEIQHYKSLLVFRSALLSWLDETVDATTA
ncbi:heme-dependent oxidative N-demethylase family protein [Rhodopila sp.]|uniref:heme-dependent oxidative N-demethylase family protein n=1 Tax=Rhodopila sp. TaxID=2480087 RepID=UPI002D80A8C1|nr:DUF3445 domain-containing protein [Rhodopila sp.]